jgi:hypothetical protein
MAAATPAPSNVKLPAAAQRQVDAAAAAIAALNAPAGDQAAAQTLANAVARGDGSRPTRAAAATPPPAAAPAAPASSNAASPPAHVTDVPPQLSVEEQLRQANARYASLQYKYNAETAALREAAEADRMMARDLLARAVPPTQPTPPPTAQSPEDFLKSIGATDGDIKDYGELLPIVVRLAQNMYRPTIEKLQTELEALKNSAQRTAVASIEDRKQAIWDELDDKVPAWRAINESEHFLDWLRVLDIFAGVTRHVALASAFKNLDRARVVAIFQAYAREYPEVARAPGAPIVDPETLVAPPIRGDQPPAAPEGSGSKKIWTETEIRNFYTRVRKKLVSQADYDAFQQEIAVAQREGRVKPDRPEFHGNAR